MGEQNVDIPAASRGFSGGQQGFPLRQSTSQRTAEQIAETPVLGGVRHGFPPGLHPSALRAVLPGEPVQGVFRTFSRVKRSATLPPHFGSELPPHSSPWTPAAYAVPVGLEEEKEEEEERPIPMVQAVLRTLSLAVAPAQGGQCPCYAGRAGRAGHPNPCRGAEAVSHGPDRSAVHGDSPDALGYGGRRPCCVVVQDVPVVPQRPIPVVLLTMEIPQFLFDKMVSVPVV